MSLFKMWEDAFVNKTLPTEWPIWEDFRTWAINNRYKSEYGYKGEFSPQGCLKAMPSYEATQDSQTDIFGESDESYEPDEEVDINFAIDSEKDPEKLDDATKEGGSKNAGKKTNARGRSGNSV